MSSPVQILFVAFSDAKYFTELPIDTETQLKDQVLYEQLQQCFNRQTNRYGNSEDIDDGTVYEKYFQPGGNLSCRENISSMWNTDGMQVFNSSTFTVWPLYFIINELPYELHTRYRNFILGGLWFGYTKPSMHSQAS